MSRNAVVTGAGSGVGRAVAIKLAREGWKVVIVGRTMKSLQETARLAGDQVMPIVCDIADAKQVREMAARAAEIGDVEALVNCAGTNVPRRTMKELSLEDFDQIVSTNLRGGFLCVQAFLPQMRQRRSGTIVNVVSDAGLWANPKSGVAYIASKFGLAGLTDTINAEERGNGIRACGIYPGDIDTPLLKKRAQVPDEAARSRMLQAEDVAECVMLAINLPQRAVVEKLVIRPR